MRVLVALALLWIAWVGAAVYICFERQPPEPPSVFIDEPDAGPGVLPASADCSVRVWPEPLLREPRHKYDYQLRRRQGSNA